MHYKDISYSVYKGEVLNLDKIQVYYEDYDPNSAIFGVSGIPSEFSIGKHSFFINPAEDFVMDTNGQSNRLKISTQVKAEIIDKVGNRVYFDYPWRIPSGFEIVDGIRYAINGEFAYGYQGPNEGQTGLALSLQITDEIQDGTGTIILVGELENVPPQWSNTYNVRWKRPITIIKSSLNSSRLYFYSKPTIAVDEIIKNYILYTFTSPTTSSIVSGSVCSLYIPPPDNGGSGNILPIGT